MSDWRRRAIINNDVVFFKYVIEEFEQKASEVFVWDLDKTYLDTRWESVKELFNTAFEKAFHKRNVPGTAALVLALKENWEIRTPEHPFPIYYITASPPQIEYKIIEKLQYDGIYPFGMFYKDNLRNLRPGRLWRLTQQVGYKLQALLEMRLRLHPRVKQVLWGDDSEADAIIYSLYSDICARRQPEDQIRELLRSLHVGGAQSDVILDLQDQIPDGDPVEKIYINLASDTDSDYYLKFGRRTLATSNSFQAVLDLFQDRRVLPHAVIRVAQDMMMNYGFTYDELERSLDDLIRRSVLGAPCVADVIPLLKEHNLISADYQPSVEPKPIRTLVEDRVYELEGVHEPWVPEFIDYLHDYR